jgi:2-haloacid dehalogenase
MPFHDIRVIAFAAYGTLFDIAAAVAEASARLGPRTGTVASLWQAKIFEYGTLSAQIGRTPDAWTITGEALDHALAACGAADLLLRAQLMQAALQAPLYPDAAPALAALGGSRRKLALLTNAAPTMAISLVKAGGVYASFDALLSTETVGTRKPLPAAYALLSERFGVAPASVLYVSAHAWDVAGAARAGLSAAWLNRSGTPPEYGWARPAAELGSLSELPGLLPALAA